MKLKIIDETNEVKNNIQRMEFMEKYNIHEDYYDFFTVEKVTAINSFIKCMEIRKIEYIPKNEYIFNKRFNILFLDGTLKITMLLIILESFKVFI